MPGIFKKGRKMEEKLTKVNEEASTDALVVNAENAAEIVRTGKGILMLSKATNIGGKETDSIYFDLSSVSALKYRDIIKKVERQNRMPISDPSKDIDVQIAIFSEASGITVAELKSGLSMKDIAQVGMVTYYFLAA